jgi:hypothetical protein
VSISSADLVGFVQKIFLVKDGSEALCQFHLHTQRFGMLFFERVRRKEELEKKNAKYL